MISCFLIFKFIFTYNVCIIICISSIPIYFNRNCVITTNNHHNASKSWCSSFIFDITTIMSFSCFRLYSSFHDKHDGTLLVLVLAPLFSLLFSSHIYIFTFIIIHSYHLHQIFIIQIFYHLLIFSFVMCMWLS